MLATCTLAGTVEGNERFVRVRWSECMRELSYAFEQQLGRPTLLAYSPRQLLQTVISLSQIVRLADRMRHSKC